MPFQKGVCPNPKGRGAGNKDKDQIPPEIKKMLHKLKNISPAALDVLIEAMVKTLPDGTVLKDVKIAEKLIQMYFATLKVSEDLKVKTKPASELPAADETPSKPKFTLEVVNPTNGKKVSVSKA
jgi:hypothetical protein